MNNGVNSIGFVRKCNIFLSLIFVLFMMISEVAASQDGGWTGNVNVFLGAKVLDEDEWSSVEDQGVIGLQIDFRPRSWPVNIVIDLLGAYEEKDYGGEDLSVKYESITSEFNVGVRKIWERFAYVRPFIGGGLSFIHREFSVEASFQNKFTYDDDAAGLWFGGGVYWTLAGHFNIGLKVFSANIALFGFDDNAR